VTAPAELLPAGRPRRGPTRSWVALLVPAVVLFAILIALGTWQLQRKAWKEGLIATLTERLAEPPSALPPPAAWSKLDQASDEYRRVTFSATFDHAKEALVYGAASAFRPDVSGVGYWVLTPARLPGGGMIIVNRGFIPEGRQGAASRPEGQVTGAVDIVGAMRWRDPRSMFSPADNPTHNLWFIRDPAAVAAAKGLGSVAPFYVEQEGPIPPGGLPQPGKLVVHLRDPHLGYAVTWYGLALGLVGVFVAWALRSRRLAAVENSR
jgi:surfeit locus 1 family protein